MTDAMGRPGSILVLGAGSEIAQATVTALAAGGLRSAVLAAREPSRLEDDAARLREAGVRTELIAFDADWPGSHQAVVDEAVGLIGDLDVVLVAFGTLGHFDPLDHDDAVRVFTTNTVGAVSVIAPAARRLLEQGHGAVVVLSSVAAERPRRSNPAYGSSKAGLDSYCQALRDRLAGRGPRIIVVRPGFVRTAMTAGLRPAPLATDPETVAHAIVTALRGGPDTIWVPARMRLVGLAMRAMPRAIFRRLDL